MTIHHFNRLDDIPEIEKFDDILPVFATQEYARFLKKTKDYSTIWFYGITDPGIQFIIPFTIKNKFFFKKGQFLTATIYSGNDYSVEVEREFLNSIVEIIKKERLCDWIEQPPNWALFNVVPSNSIHCEFGSYRIDLSNSYEDELFKKINYHHKRLLKKSKDKNIIIKSGSEFLEDCGNVFLSAAAIGNHTLITKNELKTLFECLPKIVNTYVAYIDSVPQSSIVYFSNKFCLYTVYIGNVSFLSSGGNHLLHWQAIKDAKKNGIKYFDFIGARINPKPGSKQEGIQKFKKYFGGDLELGYLWKMPINKFKYKFYELFVRTSFFLKRKKYVGDIIDQELKG